MALSSDLIDQLVKVVQNTEPRDKDNTAYGTIVIMGSKKYVKIDGSDLMTPVSTTVAVENGDRVIVTIKSHSATVTGNTSSPAASDKKVTELGTKISDFEIVIADKVSAKELDVQIGRIDDLTADNATIKESLTANKAKIDDLTAKNAEITGTLEANKAKIDDLDAKKLDAEVADIKYASVDRLDATDANLRNLESDYAQFEKTTTGELEATNAKIDGLDTKYANVDFSNIGKAAIEQFYATSGIIKDLVVGDQTITGELVGITITGDLIKGNTIVADKLVIKGSDGLYYKLNTDGVTTEKEQTEYNSLNGQIIQAKSITATKIDVKDLVAFGATIGGFNIGQDSIFSGVKETVDNKSRGIYMDKNGQIAIGDVNNYIKYFKDTDGRYRLKISAASLEFNASGDSGEESKDLETVIKDINDKVDGIAKTNKGIGSITNYYLATSESSGVTTKTAGWTTKIQNVSSSKKYLWNYEVTKYTDDTVANTTEPCIIGMYSAVGATGNGIQKITEYYALSALKDSVPTVWSENVPNLTATNKYLWNYEEILYTNGGTELTKKRIIGVYGDTGKDGAKGEDGYSPTATISKNGDTTTITIVDKTGTHTQTIKDGINGTPGKDGTNGKTTYFHVKYSNDGGKTFTSNSGETVGSYIGTCTNYTEADPTAVGSYAWAKIKGEKGDTGAKGVGVSSVDVMYYKSTSATSLSGGSWVTTDPGWENGKYIWSKTVITYTDKTTDESTPVCITGAKGSTGGTGAKGETGAAGKGVTSIVEQYYQSTSATALSGGSWSEKYPGWVNGKYIWTRSVITYTDKTSTTTTAVCVTGAKGSTGNNGKSIGSVINYYLATSASSGVSTSTSGWTTAVQNVTLEKKYLWNYEVVKYTDGTVASTTSPCIIGTYGDTGKTGATGKNALQVLKQWNGTYTTIGQEVNCPTDRFNRIPVTGDMFTNVDASSNLGTWKITKVADGQAYFKMVSYVSAKGATGATGNGIKSIKEHYAVSTSNTVTPTSWLDDVPVTNPVNKYLWNYETITYTNGTSVDSKKRVIGVYGDTGKDGAKGEDFKWNLVKGTSVASTAGWSVNGWGGSFDTLSKDERTYKFVASNGWHVARYVNLKEYVGQNVTISFYAKNVSAETTATEAYSLFITNATGANPYVTGYLSNDNPVQDSWIYCSYTCKLNSDGQLGIGSFCTPEGKGFKSTWLIKDLKIELGSPATPWSPHPDDLVGADGKGIKSTAVTYQASTSGTVIPTGTWQTSIPTVSAGQYLWTRTVITYTDDSKSTSYSVGRMGTNGTNGSAGRGIKSTAITYQAGSSGTTAPAGTWQTTVPATSASMPYLWTRTIITYTDDTTSTSYAVGSTLEGVSVGGRNLARKTSNKYCAAFNSFNGGDNICPNLATVSTAGLTVGDRVTVRLVYKYTNIVAVTGKTAAAWLQGAGNITEWKSGTFVSNQRIALSGSGEKVIKYSFVITSDMIKNQCWYVNIRHDGVKSGSVQWKEFKVEKGNIATDWTPAPEDSIASVDVEYYLSTSATALSGGSWSTTAPTWVNGKYMWSRTVTTDGAGNKTYSPNQNGVCIAGAKGETGNTALTFKKNFTGTYTTVGDGSNAMLTSFNRTPVVGDIFTNIDGSSNTGTWEITKIENDRAYFKLLSYVSSKGATGATGATGKGVLSIVEQYYKSTSATALSGGSWSTTYPGWESGKYIWTRSVITYTDKTTTTTTAVCVTGTKGSTGPQGPAGPQGPKGESDIKCYPLTGGQNQFVWSKLGTLTSAGDSSIFIINIYTGNGFNGGSTQNSQAEIVIKDGWQSSASTTSAFGVSVTRQNCDNLKVQVRATASNKCDVWIYLPWSYGSGTYTISGKYTSWSLSNTTQTAEPTTGTLQDLAYRMNSENAAKTATNFMEFTSGTGLQIGDKTNGSWKGFRSRITSTAFEILNEAGSAVASYGRKLIQLGKDTTDAVIELCGGKGIIKYENVWLYGGEDDTLTINAENMAILADKNIVIRAKRITDDNIRITNQLFMSDDNIHLTMYEMNADLPDEADDCIAGIDIDKKSGINLETLGVTDRSLTGVSINGRSLLDHIYPVGSIYMSTSATNPTNFFGGTWVAWGAGRVPVGFSGGDGNFNSSEKTGGSKTINIEHNHGLSNARAAVGRADSSLSTMSYTSGGNPHNVYFDREFSYWGGIAGVSKHATDTAMIYGNTNNGGSTAASVLQPYITCYMWKRTA